MRISEIPKVNFWPYDLFGYLLPGGTLLAALAFGDSRASTYLRTLWDSGRIPDFLLLAFLAYITGTCISAISSLALEQGFLQVTFKYPTSRLFAEQDERRPRWWIAITRSWPYAPFRWFGHLIAPRYCQPYPEDFRGAVKDAFDLVFKADFQKAHTRFWLCWSYITLHHPAAYRRGSHFVELYGFSRNTCMSFVLIAALPLLSSGIWRTWKAPMPVMNWTGPSLLIALFFFANYLKLFKRMDDELFHAFLVAAHAPVREERKEEP